MHVSKYEVWACPNHKIDNEDYACPNHEDNNETWAYPTLQEIISMIANKKCYNRLFIAFFESPDSLCY